MKHARASGRAAPAPVIWVLAVLVTGTLDLIDAMAFHAFRGVAPMQILQSIAGGFLGRSTFQGGVPTALVGAATHYAIIGMMLAAYVFARARNAWLQRHLVAGGLLYGCLLFVAMSFVVLPLSAAVEFLRPMTVADVLNGVFAHAVLVGLPIAWFARRLQTPGSPGAPSSAQDTRGAVGLLIGLAVLGASPMTSHAGAASSGPPPAGFVGISRWMNSPPLDLADLRGKIVLIDFWTYSCVNCQRTLPYLKRWHADYGGHGLVVVGVHSPEFDEEKKPGNVRQAMRRFGIDYAVAIDNDFATWNAWNISAWPTKILVDADGSVVLRQVGEGHYARIENAIRERLGLAVSAPDAAR